MPTLDHTAIARVADLAHDPALIDPLDLMEVLALAEGCKHLLRFVMGVRGIARGSQATALPVDAENLERYATEAVDRAYGRTLV